VSYVLVGGYWASFLAISEDPDGLWARVLSLFPATAPLAMPGRIALGATAWWEPYAAVILALVTIGVLISFAGRVYQNAVLHTGSVLRLRDAWHLTPTDAPRAPATFPIQKVTRMLTPQNKPMAWTIVLTAIGFLAAAVIFALTRDAIWSVVALLLAVAAVRRVPRHR
jgi:ABC-2 type transport system permease protein